MGYTHYWSFKETSLDEKEVNQVVNELNKIIQNLPEKTDTAGGVYKENKLKLVGWNGKGKPVINTKELSFNGNGDLGHESFYISLNKPDSSDFCKTNRKPYDLFVCCVLISLRNNINGFYFKTDGDIFDWTPAINLYEELIGDIRFNLDEVFE